MLYRNYIKYDDDGNIYADIPLTTTDLVQFKISFDKINTLPKVHFYNERILTPDYNIPIDIMYIHFDKIDYVHQFNLIDSFRRKDFIKWIYDIYEQLWMEGKVFFETKYVLHHIIVKGDCIYLNG